MRDAVYPRTFGTGMPNILHGGAKNWGCQISYDTMCGAIPSAPDITSVLSR